MSNGEWQQLGLPPAIVISFDGIPVAPQSEGPIETIAPDGTRMTVDSLGLGDQFVILGSPDIFSQCGGGVEARSLAPQPGQDVAAVHKHIYVYPTPDAPPEGIQHTIQVTAFWIPRS